MATRVTTDRLVDRVRDRLDRRSAPAGTTRWVGIDGRGGAGKTTLAARLAAGLDYAIVVHVDDFARPSIPTWDQDRFLGQLVAPLRAGQPARYQRWLWATDTGGDWVTVPPGRTLVVEGVSATDVRLGIDWDCTIWVETAADERRARALRRDGEAMSRLWWDRWDRTEQAYVDDQRPQDRADLVVSGSG